MYCLIVNDFLFGGHREVAAELLQCDHFNVGERRGDARSIKHIAPGKD
jgi:hypothetical protein